jgi:hypothetical protein
LSTGPQAVRKIRLALACIVRAARKLLSTPNIKLWRKLAKVLATDANTETLDVSYRVATA